MMTTLQIVLMKRMKIGPIILVSVHLINGSKGKRRLMRSRKSSPQVTLHFNSFHCTNKPIVVVLLKFDAIDVVIDSIQGTFFFII